MIKNELNNVLKNKTKIIAFIKQYWQYIVIAILAFALLFSCNRTTKLKYDKKIANQNETALSDSVRKYKDKLNNVIFEKNIQVSENASDLAKTNKELSTELSYFKNKEQKDIVTISKLNSYIDFLKGKNDSLKSNITIADRDTTKGINSIKTVFDFSNKYRELEGGVDVTIDKAKYQYQSYLIKDKIKFNLITGIKDNGKDGFEIYVKSDNPYFAVDSINGAIIKPDYFKKYNKEKKFDLSIQAGYGITKSGLSPYIGIGLSYKLINLW